MADNTIANAIKFLKGEEKSLPATKTEGQVYFAYKNVGTAEKPSYTGAIYIDTPIGGTQTRVKMTANADIADKAFNDSAGLNIRETYLSSLGYTDDGKQTILIKGSGNNQTKIALPIASTTKSGIVTTDAQSFGGTKIFTTINSTNLTVTGSDSFNYSGIGSGTVDVARPVWFADNSTNGKPVVNTNFTYNPVTQTLSVANLSGTADKANKDNAGSDIRSTYISNITLDNSIMTITKGSGATSTLNIKDKLYSSAVMATKEDLDKFIEANVFKFGHINAIEGYNGLEKNDGIILSGSWNSSTNYGHQIYIDDNGYALRHRYRNNGNWSDWASILDSTNYNSYAPTKTGGGASGTWGINISGNAATATKLQTARTLWGQSFDGTGNVSGTISGCTRIINATNNSLYLGNNDNTSWVYTQNIASQAGQNQWMINQTGLGQFKNINIGYLYDERDASYALKVKGNTLYNGKLYFANNTTYYINESADANLRAVGTSDNTYIVFPQGGGYRNTVDSITGYLKITLPVTWTSTMMSFKVTIYEYQSNLSCTYFLHGYNYSGSNAWYSTSAYSLSKSDARTISNRTVRFGHDGSKCAIYIGESNSTWNYPKVQISDIMIGHGSTDYETWASGWSVGFTTTLGTITDTIATPNVSYSAATLQTNAGNSARPVYFANGVPITCDDTLSNSITGSAYRLTLDHPEQKGLGGLYMFQKYGDTNFCPSENWWSILRTQHPGYDNGFWQEMAYSFFDDRICFRRNNNGSKSEWRTLAFTDSDITGKSASTDAINWVAGNEIRFTKPSHTKPQGLHFGWAWADGSKVKLISEYIFDGGDGQRTQVSASQFNGNLNGNANTASNADKLDGYHGSSSQAAGTYVLRDGSGYIYTNYINSNTSNNENPSISQIIVTNGSDNFYRKASLSHLKSSLGSMPASDVYAWAKASTKPVYTWGEINGKPSTFTPSSHEHNYIIGYGTNTISSLSKDTPAEWGKCKCSVHWYTTSNYITDQPSQWGYLINIGTPGEVHQIWLSQPGQSIVHRGGNVNGWEGSWKVMLDSSNYTSYTVTKSGGGASGTWGINVTGSAGSVAWGNVSGKPSTFTPSPHEHSYVLDVNDGSHTTFAYSKAGMNYGDYTWLAAWNGTELRAINKSQFATASHTHPYLPLSGGTMTGTINFTTNKLACMFGGSTSSYYSGVMHQNFGTEAIVFAATNTLTSFIFKCGQSPISMANNTWANITPSMQIKKQSVYINSLIANGVTPGYNLYVNGTTRCNGTLGVGNGSNAQIDFFSNSSSTIGARIKAYNDRIEFVFS